MSRNNEDMEKNVEFIVDDSLKLAGVLHRPAAGSGGGVVLCHGMLADKDGPKHRELARRLCELGHLVLRFDFAGRGQSQGSLLELTISSQMEQCRQAVRLVRGEGARRLALIGSSLGGTTAMGVVAAHDDCDCLVTMAAPSRLDRLGVRLVGEAGLESWRRQGWQEIEGQRVGYSLVEDARQHDIDVLAARIACPWLILHGERDQLVPLDDARRLAGANSAARLQVVAGADHRFSQAEHFQEVVERAVQFAHQKLSGKLQER